MAVALANEAIAVAGGPSSGEASAGGDIPVSFPTRLTYWKAKKSVYIWESEIYCGYKTETGALIQA